MYYSFFFRPGGCYAIPPQFNGTPRPNTPAVYRSMYEKNFPTMRPHNQPVTIQPTRSKNKMAAKEVGDGRFCQVDTGSAFIKPDQLDPWIKDQLGNALLSTILHLQIWNFVSCGRACPSHMTQNFVTVVVKLLRREWFLFYPWSMDQAELVW